MSEQVKEVVSLSELKQDFEMPDTRCDWCNGLSDCDFSVHKRVDGRCPDFEPTHEVLWPAEKTDELNELMVDTLEDVVSEMRKCENVKMLGDWPNRIERINRRNIESEQGIVEDLLQMQVDYDSLKAENERLKNELKTIKGSAE